MQRRMHAFRLRRHALHLSAPVDSIRMLLFAALCVGPVQVLGSAGERPPSDALSTRDVTTARHRQGPDDTATFAAAATQAARQVDLARVGTGELLWRTDRGFLPLPVLHTEVSLRVTGIMLHGKLTQRFHNSSRETIEALFVFPLPENAAVHHMEIRVGNRRIVSEVQERVQARRTYEQAREQGKKAALVEQERPNLFTTSVANIDPGSSIDVVLEYIEEVEFRDGAFRMTFPLTYTPRYIPDASLRIDESSGASAIVSAVVPDADRVTPPFVESYSTVAPTAEFRARIRAGVPLARIGSPSHDVRVTARDDMVLIEPASALLPADRDVVIEWEPAVGEAPEAALLVDARDGERYALLMLVPPSLDALGDAGLATETLFVIDVSGSMAGPSIEHAREALVAALERLRPSDRFNILRFNDGHSLFAEEFRDATPRNVAAAHGWVRGLRANGGTEIYGALLRGMTLFAPRQPTRIQRIIFLTDGSVGNEAQMLRRIAAGRGRVRLHTVGIGHAPNRYLMRKMAEVGGGVCEFIASTRETENRIDRFFARLDRPVMTDLTLEWEELEAFDVQPPVLPDLHAGEPLFVSAKLRPGGERGRVVLHGRALTGPVRHTFAVETSRNSDNGIATRWARARVGALMDRLHAGEEPDSVRVAVIDVALKHHLVTRYTSLVAVEEEITAHGAPHRVRVANALPHGSQLLRAALPRGGTASTHRRVVGLVLLSIGVLVLALGGLRGGRHGQEIP